MLFFSQEGSCSSSWTLQYTEAISHDVPGLALVCSDVSLSSTGTWSHPETLPSPQPLTSCWACCNLTNYTGLEHINASCFLLGHWHPLSLLRSPCSYCMTGSTSQSLFLDIKNTKMVRKNHDINIMKEPVSILLASQLSCFIWRVGRQNRVRGLLRKKLKNY